jgi:hypothetical protein
VLTRSDHFGTVSHVSLLLCDVLYPIDADGFQYTQYAEVGRVRVLRAVSFDCSDEQILE